MDDSSSNSPAQLRTETVGGSNISDQPSDSDLLGFKPYVEAVCAFLTHKDTKPPLVVSVEGEWGSGKSSFMRLLRRAIERSSPNKTVTIWFNAWRLEKEDALWAAFALLVTEKLSSSVRPIPRIWAHIKLMRKRFDWKQGTVALARFAVTLLCLIYISIVVFQYVLQNHQALNPLVADLSKSSEKQPPPDPGQKSSKKKTDQQKIIEKADAQAKPSETQSDEKKQSVKTDENNLKERSGDQNLIKLLLAAGGGTAYLFLAIWFVKELSEKIGNPFKIDLKKFSGKLNYEERVSFIERFHADFSKVIDAYAEDRTVFVFIDDLDRCELSKAADLMQAINLLLGDSTDWRVDEGEGQSKKAKKTPPKLVYILGLDREKIAAGLAAKFEKILPYLGLSNQDPARIGLSFGYNYLEKFIQIPIRVPYPTATNIDDLLNKLNAVSDSPERTPEPSSVSSGILFETQVDSDLVKTVVKMAAPALEFNPRRIKQFINCFRIGAIIASQTGLLDTTKTDYFTVQQLGKLILINLRYPSLIDDGIADSGLFGRLEYYAFTGPPANDKSHEIERYWYNRPQLMGLFQAGIESASHREQSIFSIGNVSLDLFLRVSPRVSFPSTSDERRDESLGENLNERSYSQASYEPARQTRRRQDEGYQRPA